MNFRICPEIVTCGAMVLCAMCMTDKLAAKLVEAGGVEGFIKALKKNERDCHLVESGLRAIRGLAAGGESSKEAVVQAGAAPFIADCMDSNQENASLCLEAISALGNLTHRAGVQGRKAVIWAHGIQHTVRTMRRFAKNLDVQRASCKALRNFIAGDETGNILLFI